jgi:hypothetical protein
LTFSSPNLNTECSQAFTSDEIISFILYPTINAALESLSKEVKSHSPPVDGGILDYLSVDFGLFPRHQGGLLWYAEKSIKFQTIVQGLKDLSAKFPEGDDSERFVACELLESIVESSSSLTEELYFRMKYQQQQ